MIYGLFGHYKIEGYYRASTVLFVSHDKKSLEVYKDSLIVAEARLKAIDDAYWTASKIIHEKYPTDLHLPEKPKPSSPLVTKSEQEAWIPIKRAWEAEVNIIHEKVKEYNSIIESKIIETLVSEYPEIASGHRYYSPEYDDYSIQEIQELISI